MKQNDEIFLHTTDLGKSGEGIAYYKNKKIFVKQALKDEKIVAKITNIKQEYAEAQIVKIEKSHPFRIKPACTKFKDCGACNLMHLDYEYQLNYKKQIISDALAKLSYFNESMVFNCIASPKPLFYRNKVQLPLGLDNKVICGFYKEKSHEIIPYTQRLVHDEAMKDTALIITNCINNTNIKPYCEKTHHGLLRHFIIRINKQKEMLIGLVATRQEQILYNLANNIINALKNIKGVVLSVNNLAHNKILGDNYQLLLGQDFLIEEILGLQFRLSLPSFFQINRLGAEILYSTALNFANLKATDKAIDAYCGVGTLSLLAATKCQKVIGIECIKQAVIDADKNAELNQIKNANFICGLVQEQTHLFKDIDVAFVNPPRKGMDKEVVKAINDFGPTKVVYISCNPQTLARDILEMSNYKLIKVQPIDMFPQTVHVESVAFLEKI